MIRIALNYMKYSNFNYLNIYKLQKETRLKQEKKTLDKVNRELDKERLKKEFEKTQKQNNVKDQYQLHMVNKNAVYISFLCNYRKIKRKRLNKRIK